MNLEVLPNLSDHLGLFPDYTVREFTNTIHHNDKRTSIPVISKSVSQATGANDSHGQSASESDTSWLFSLHAISLQILVLALFASLTSYARADTNDELPSGSASYF